MTFVYKGTEYTLSDTLRVAYRLQTMHKHESYVNIFEKMGRMPIEKQLQFIYISFDIANPNVAKESEFIDWCLDNMGLEQIAGCIESIIDGIMYRGLSEDETKEKKRKLELMER